MKIRCSCIRGNYNVLVKALDKGTLTYQDFSDWMDEPRYEFPESYIVRIIPPGKGEGVLLELSTTKVNKLTSKEVGMIKDGMWCFQTESCGVTYKKTIGIFYSIECCIRKAWATEPERRYDAIEEVERYVNLSKMAVELNNIKEATEHLEIAQDKLDRIKCDCDC